MKAVIDAATIRILLHLSERGDARYSELKEEVTRSRSTLALALRELQEIRLMGERSWTRGPCRRGTP